MAIAKYYLNRPDAPRPNSPTRIGTNVLLEWGGKLLLECRWDCEEWGLIGGRLRHGESYSKGIARELREETGIFLPESAFKQVCIISDDRIASYQDGTVWRMMIVLFQVVLSEKPILKPSRESNSLAFFSPEALKDLPIVETHLDLIKGWKPGYTPNYV